MKILQRLFVTVAIAGSAFSMHAANASNYKPADLKMWLGDYTTSSNVSQDMVLLGENADGQQIWACNKPNPSKNNLHARWSESSGRSMSANERKFEKNQKYSISTSYNDISYECEISGDTTDLYVVKPLTSTEAEMFIWDGTSTVDFIKEFYLAPRITMVADNVYLDSYSDSHQKVTYTITGITLDAIDHIDLESHTDGAEGWGVIANITNLSGSVDVNIVTRDAYHAYRIKIYLKDKYKIFAKDGLCSSTETGLLTGNVIWENYGSFNGAIQLYMNTGLLEYYDIKMKIIGVTKEGYQIWTCNNDTGGYSYTYWHYGDSNIGDDKYSATFTSLGTNEELTIKKAYEEGYTRKITDDPSKRFFYRKYNPYVNHGATLFCWDMSTTPSFISKYYINGYFDLTVDDPVLLADKKSYVQHMCWRLESVTSELFDKAEIQKSLDGGKTWETFHTDGALYGNAYVEIPATQKNVRYRAIAYPKDMYKIVVANGCWISTSTNKALKPTDLSCTVTASAIDPDKDFVYDATAGSKSFKTTVEWNCSDNMTELFGGGELQYSVDKGKTWHALANVSAASGSEDVVVPVGCSDYLFRANIYPSTNVSDEALYSISAVSDTVKVAYNEKDISVSLRYGDVTPVDGYNDLSTVPLTYTVSKTLWQLCDKAYFTYSFDYYKTTSHALPSFTIEESGKTEIIMPNNIAIEDLPGKKGACTIGLKIYYTINGERKYYEYYTAPIYFPSDK